jgi:hypothetical protein
MIKTNNELEIIWKEAVVALFKVLSRYLLGKAKENHETLSKNIRSPGRELNPGPPEYEFSTRP